MYHKTDFEGGSEIKLLIEQDDGAMVEVKEIEGVSSATNVLILISEMRLSNSESDRIVAELARITGKQCIILPPYIKKVIGV